MRASKEFRDLVGEVLAPLGNVVVRSMFGGAGVFSNGVMFALIADDVLYLRVDEHTKPHFEKQGLSQFVYQSPTKTVGMPYYEAPPAVFDDTEVAVDWGAAALEAAKSSGTGKRKA
jgi:DNA transformation protein and related proteins